MNGVDLHEKGESPLPSPSPFVRFYPFADGGILFLEGSRRIWGLNAPAAFLWCSLDGIRHGDDLAKALAERFSIDETTARRDTAATLSCFEKEGVLGEGFPADLPEESSGWEIPPSAPILTERSEWALRALFRTPNHIIEFCGSDAGGGRAFVEHMSHFSLDRRERVDTHLALLADSGAKEAWDIYLDGRRFAQGVADNGVLPYLLTLVFVRTCAALQDELLFHAAVMGWGERTVLFPAEAGSGKTTLAAALAARGCQFLTDELAILEVGNLRITPFPMPMSIKPGSVKALERYYPGLASATVYHRADGKRVRYLSPPPGNLPQAGDTAVPVDSIVFPVYREGAETRLTPLAKIDALQRLATTGSSDRKFLSRDIEAMLALVERTPCLELAYSDLEEAMALLERQAGGPGPPAGR